MGNEKNKKDVETNAGDLKKDESKPNKPNKSKKQDMKNQDVKDVKENTGSESCESCKSNETEIEKLENENGELKDQLLRQMAEFENFRKRTTKERTEIYSMATAGCVKEFLTVLDNFDRAMASQTTDETFKNGMGMILKQFKDVLSKIGVTEIEALNQPFNPDLHEAVSQTEDENFPENTVCNVYQKGYMMGDKVVRHAVVIVANP